MSIISVQTILYLNYFVLSIFTSGLSIVILQLVVNYGIDEVTAGNLVNFKSIFVVAISLGSAYVVKLGYKNSMLLGLIGVTTASILIATVRDFWAVPVLFALAGLSHTFIKLSVYSTIGLIADERKKHTGLMNRVEGAYIIGGLVGPLLFSWMIQWHSWHDAYWTIAILTTLVFLLLLNTNIDESAVNQELEKPSFSQILTLLNYPLLWVFVICVLLSGMLELGFKTWLPTFNTEVFKLSEAQSVLFLSTHAGAIAIGRFLLGYLQERFSWLYIQVANLAFAFILTLAVLTLTGDRTHYVILLASIFSLIGFFYGSIYPTICSIMLSYLPKVRHTAMSGLIVIFAQFGIALGVSTIGFLSKHFNIHNAFYVILLPMGILPFLLIFYNKLSHRFDSKGILP